MSHSTISLPFLLPPANSSLSSLDSDCETDEEPSTITSAANQENIQPNNRISPSRKRSRVASPARTRIAGGQNSRSIPSAALSLTTPGKLPAILSHDLTDCVTLIIGGSVFVTTFSTLLSVENSYFTGMFSSQFADSRRFSDDGKIEAQKIFIDRDGTHFRYILNYLRDRSIIVDHDNIPFLYQLLAEANYYSLDGMAKEIQKIIENSQELERERDMEKRELKLQNRTLSDVQPQSDRSTNSALPALHRSHSQPFSGLISQPIYRPPTHAFPGPAAFFDFPEPMALQHSTSMPPATGNSSMNLSSGSFEFTTDADF